MSSASRQAWTVDEPGVGEPQHWYPYSFIDVNDPSALVPGLEGPGYQGVADNIVAILTLGLVFAFIFLGIDRWFSGGRKPTPLDGSPEQSTQEWLDSGDAQAPDVASGASD